MTFRQKIKTFREKVKRLPKLVRISVGILLVLFGLVGFLPVLGFWMVPVGLAVLAIDIPAVKKLVHRMMSAFNRWRRKRRGK
ncbi:MAG: hypothetical protein IT566_10275 [Rhodospirillaceae bacterium]|nr:hypothetical protein [Rhodospirillaceae bacterium]